MTIYANDARFLREDDAATIQAAIDYAAAQNMGRVTVPRHTADGRDVWQIARAILLPSNMTVILQDCHLRMADGVRENMFRNQNAYTPLGNTLEGEQHDIRLIGEGCALLDGGEPNGLCEQLHRDDPTRYPSMFVNLTVLFHNVRDFEVRGITFRDCRYWATCFVFCRFGRIADLHMQMHGTLENQDGIDLRIGCEYITIENITGLTGDDTVALTALPGKNRNQYQLTVEGKSIDIHDVTIRNVTSATHGCGIVRLLNANGARLYNVTISDVKDTGEAISTAAVLIGTTDPMLLRDCPHRMGDFENVVIRNVFSHAQRALNLAGSCRNLTIENVVAQHDCNVGVRFCKNFAADNVLLHNFVYQADADRADCVFCCDCTPEGLNGLTVERVKATAAKYTFRGVEFPVQNGDFDAPSEAFLTNAPLSLPSAYGRYHKFFYGKLITNRPADNRFDGTLK